MKHITIHPLEDAELSTYKGEVEILEAQAKTLAITDDVSEGAATIFIAGCKKLQADMEADRKSRVEEMNREVRAINESYKPFDTILDRLWRVTDTAKSAYITKKQAAIEAANRKAIADAEAARREKERKEREAREEAERLRLEAERVKREEINRQIEAEMERLRAEQAVEAAVAAAEAAAKAGDVEAEEKARAIASAATLAEEERKIQDEMDRLAAQQEQARLEKDAAKQEVKADTAQSQALMASPQLVDAESATGTRTLTNGAKVGGRKDIKWAFTNGMDIEGEYTRDDPRVQEIGDRYFILDTKKLGKDVKNGVPVHGTVRLEGMATTLRK